MILRVHVKGRESGPLEFDECTALREGAAYVIVHGATHEVVARIQAEDVERLHYVETLGDGTE